MTKIKAVNGAGKAFYANHLAANDYYSEQEKVIGTWQGKLAYDFILTGKEVDTETFSLFQRNINPRTYGKLTQRTVMTGVRFFDFQCAAPKSVSVMSLWDERLEAAHKTALALVYERESVVKLDKVLAEALNQNLGMVNLETLKKTAARIPELRNLGGLEVNPWVSPEEVIEREIYAVEAVEEQKDVFPPIAPDFAAFPGETTRAKQAELIHGILNSKDRFNLFRGVAGAGKTSTLQELCRGLRSGGVESIYLIAPTNSAADVLRQEGFEQSQTVAAFLLSQKKPPAGSYVIIDEAELNSLREGAELIKTARANNYRVLFVGDARQHTAVESGDFFRLLEDHSKIERFSLSDIYRQQNEEYRRGISECALGKFEAAFERFDRNGFIREGKAKYLENAAETYMEYTENGEFIDRSLLVAPTHDEGDKLTAAVRAKLKAAGAVAMSGRTTEIFRSWSKPKAWLKDAANYSPGTVVAFIRNMKGIGNAGETAQVERSENGMLYLDNGKCLYAKAASERADSQMVHDTVSEPIKPHQLMIIEKKIANKQLRPLTSKEKAKLTKDDFSRLLKESWELEAVAERAASQMNNNALADKPIKPHQLAIIEKKIAGNLLPILTSEEKSKLTQRDFVRLLEESRERKAAAERAEQEKQEQIPKPELEQVTREPVSYPASNSQMKVLDDLRERGKIQEIPENMTQRAASKIINDALADEPIAPQQLAIIEKKIASNELPPLTSEEKTKLTQGDFSRLLKESLKRSRKTSSLRTAPVISKKPSRGMDL